MTEAERLAVFLLALQTSPALRERFELDPIGQMTQFNLEPRTIAAVLRKQPAVLLGILDVPHIIIHQGKVAGVEKARRRPKKKSS